MEESQQMNRLEEAISTLLAGYNDIKAEKELLEESLAASELELKELRESISALKAEKNVIHDRVNRLIGSIEKWEKSQPANGEIAVEDSSQPVDGQDQKTPDAQGRMFSMQG